MGIDKFNKIFYDNGRKNMKGDEKHGKKKVSHLRPEK